MSKTAQTSRAVLLIVLSLIFEVQSRERFEHKSPAEPKPVCEYLTLDNTIHFVNAIIVFCQGFFLLISERVGKIVSVFTHKVQEIFDFPIAFGTLLLGINVPVPKLLK